MKPNFFKKIILVIASSLMLISFSSCVNDTPTKPSGGQTPGKGSEVDNSKTDSTDQNKPDNELAKIDPTGYDGSTPMDLKVNPNEAMSDSIFSVGVWLREGHSHAPESSRQLIGGTMWSTNFDEGNRNFHGNPFNSKSEIPYRRDQYIEYKKVEGKYILDPENTANYKNQNVLDILATGSKDNYLGRVVYALIVTLYDKDYNNPRIDQLFKLKDSARLQVFYRVKNVRPLRPEHNLPANLPTTDVCYYWYYDRLPKADGEKYYDDGDYFKTTPIGFRGVLQALQPYTMFDLEMSISILPKGLEKYKTNGNSITPTPIQARHIVFQFNIPFRTITSYPDFSAYAYKKMGMDYTDPNFDPDLFDKYVKEAEDIYLNDLRFVYPAFTTEQLKKLIEKQRLLPAESSDFVL